MNLKKLTLILKRSFKPSIACLLGKCYLYGRGTNRDPKKAGYLFIESFYYRYNKAIACTPHFNINPLSKNLEWYIKAAGSGHVKAMYDLGWVFQNGKLFNMQKDYISAAMWYKRAAEKGYVKAMIDLNWCYRRGKGVKKDKKKALYWLNKAKSNKSVYSKITRRLDYGDKIMDSRTIEPETILITCTCNKDIRCAVSDKSREKGIAVYEFGSRVYVNGRECFGSKKCYTRISDVKAFADKFMQNEWKFIMKAN